MGNGVLDAVHIRQHVHQVGKVFSSGPVAQSKIGRSNFFAEACLKPVR